MQDLISRKWLMECIDEGWIKFETEKDENLFIHLVRDIAPSAQPYTDEEIQKMQDIEQVQLDKAYEMGKADAMRWIPCSERLPKYGEVVLWCNQQGSVFTSAITWQRGNDYGVGQHYGAKAWMPLPEPYKEDDDGTR